MTIELHDYDLFCEMICPDEAAVSEIEQAYKMAFNSDSPSAGFHLPTRGRLAPPNS